MWFGMITYAPTNQASASVHAVTSAVCAVGLATSICWLDRVSPHQLPSLTLPGWERLKPRSRDSVGRFHKYWSTSICWLDSRLRHRLRRASGGSPHQLLHQLTPWAETGLLLPVSL